MSRKGYMKNYPSCFDLKANEKPLASPVMDINKKETTQSLKAWKDEIKELKSNLVKMGHKKGGNQ